MINHYQVLGIVPTATPPEIEAAYREKAQQFHPDRTHSESDPASAQFKAVNNAYETLRDPQKRRRYDALWRVVTATGTWTQLPLERDLRGVTLHADGSYSIGTNHVPPGVSFEETEAGPFVLDIGDHTDGELWLQAAGQLSRLRFKDGKWYLFKPGPPKAAPASKEQPRASSPPPIPGSPPHQPLALPSVLSAAIDDSAKKNPIRNWSIFCLVAMLVFVAVALAYHFGTRNGGLRAELPGQEKPEEVEAKNQERQRLLDAQKKRDELDVIEQANVQRAAIARGQWQQLAKLGQRVQAALNEWDAKRSEWENLLKDALTNEDGKIIATSCAM